MIATGQKRDYIYRLCAGNNERKKALIRWGTITLVLRMSTVLMRLYTLLIGVCNILSNNLDWEKSACCRNGNHLPAASTLLLDTPIKKQWPILCPGIKSAILF